MPIGKNRVRKHPTLSSGWYALTNAPNHPLLPPSLTLPNPNDKVIVARFGAPHGVRGCLRTHIFSRQPEFLASLPQWWCRLAGGDWQLVDIVSCRQQGTFWVTSLTAVDDRDAAILWRHGDIAILRDSLPKPELGEFYWCDLIGVRVVNMEDVYLGDITALMDGGAHDVLRVKTAAGEEILIPFVAAYIKSDTIEDNTLQVDWQADW